MAAKPRGRGWDVAAPLLNFGKTLLAGGEKPIWEYKDPLGEVTRRLAAAGQQLLARGQAWLASLASVAPPPALPKLPALPRLPALRLPALPWGNK